MPYYYSIPIAHAFADFQLGLTVLSFLCDAIIILFKSLECVFHVIAKIYTNGSYKTVCIVAVATDDIYI